MDFTRAGRSIRAIRLRAGDRQIDVAGRAGVSRERVGRVERGDATAVSVAALDAICTAVGATLDVLVRWTGTEIDRLLNAGHSAMHEEMARGLIALGWEVAPEVSFSIYGERGVIDIIAWHAGTRTLVVIELKTEVVDVQALIGTVDRYRRLAAAAVRDRGWVPQSVGAWVVVAESPTNRRRFAAHRTTLRAAFPTDGRSVGSWLRNPIGPLRALTFLRAPTVVARTAARGSRQRVRKAGGRAAARGS